MEMVEFKKAKIEMESSIKQFVNERIQEFRKSTGASVAYISIGLDRPPSVIEANPNHDTYVDYIRTQINV